MDPELFRVPFSWHNDGTAHQFPILDVAIDDFLSGPVAIEFSRPTGWIRPARLGLLKLLGVQSRLLIRPHFTYARAGTQPAITVSV